MNVDEKSEVIENNETFCFKTTPVSKVVVLSFLTGGLYDLFLIFSYWKTLRDQNGLKVSPFWRCIFAVITNYRLFPILNDYFSKFGLKVVTGSLLATIYLICSWISNKMSFRTLMIDEINYALEITILVLDLITALLLGFMQSKINRVNELNFPNAAKNQWTIGNIIWAIIFGVLTVLSLLPIE